MVSVSGLFYTSLLREQVDVDCVDRCLLRDKTKSKIMRFVRFFTLILLKPFEYLYITLQFKLTVEA